jgi:peptidylprolyl isomerase
VSVLVPQGGGPALVRAGDESALSACIAQALPPRAFTGRVTPIELSYEIRVAEPPAPLGAAATGAGTGAAPAVALPTQPSASAVETASGLFVEVLLQGRGGRSPRFGDTVVVRYQGWDTSGRAVGQSAGKETFKVAHLVPGLIEALELMTVGEKVRAFIPAALAYGDRPPAGMPAGRLIFDIELVGIEPQPPPTAEPRDGGG